MCGMTRNGACAFAERLREANRRLGDALQQSVENMIRAFQPAAALARKALADFDAALYRAAQRAYVEAHGCLPASDRTARLRKKRRKIVLDWFTTELNREHDQRQAAALREADFWAVSRTNLRPRG